jgi:hypothetical protein
VSARATWPAGWLLMPFAEPSLPRCRARVPVRLLSSALVARSTSRSRIASYVLNRKPSTSPAPDKARDRSILGFVRMPCTTDHAKKKLLLVNYQISFRRQVIVEHERRLIKQCRLAGLSAEPDFRMVRHLTWFQ